MPVQLPPRPWQPNVQPTGMRQPAAMGALRQPQTPASYPQPGGAAQMNAPRPVPGQGGPPPGGPGMPQGPISTGPPPGMVPPQGGPPPGGPPPGGPPQGMPPGLQQALAMLAQQGVPPQQAMAMLQQRIAQMQGGGPPQGIPPRGPGIPPMGNFYR